MKPDWDKHADEWADSATGGVFDVDCTASGKELCEKHGVRGYPTIKYGDPSALEDYKGGRTLKALQDFAAENLKPMCSPANMDLCEGDKKAQLEGYMAMEISELDTKITEAKGQQEKLEEDFKTEVKALQDKYQQLQTDKEEKLKALKDSGLGLMQAVKAHKGKPKFEL